MKRGGLIVNSHDYLNNIRLALERFPWILIPLGGHRRRHGCLFARDCKRPAIAADLMLSVAVARCFNVAREIENTLKSGRVAKTARQKEALYSAHYQTSST